MHFVGLSLITIILLFDKINSEVAITEMYPRKPWEMVVIPTDPRSTVWAPSVHGCNTAQAHGPTDGRSCNQSHRRRGSARAQ
jgi:hypothetical protein